MIENYYGIYKFNTSLGEVEVEINNNSRFEENIDLFDREMNEGDEPILGDRFYGIKRRYY